MAIRRADPTSESGATPAHLAGGDLPDHYLLRGRLKRRSGRPILVAIDRRDDRPVVVKVGGAAVAREAEILDRLDHPQIVRLRERFTRGGETFLVLDYVAGEDLGARLRAGPDPLPPAEVERLLRGLMAPLAHLHERGVIHRDLKPENVLICTDGTPMLVDLGAALTIGEAACPPQLSALSEAYAAPEQFVDGGPEGPFTDIHGLGAVAFRALTGRPSPLAAARDEGVPELAAYGRLGAAIAAALAPDPAARPEDVPALLAHLDQAGPWEGESEPIRGDGADVDMNDEPPPTVRIRRRPVARPTAESSPPPPLPRRRARRIIPIVVALTALLLGAAFAMPHLLPLYERHIKTTWLVDATGGGDATSIQDALDRAGPGARIAVRAGTYAEPLVLDEAAHLAAEDPEAPPVVAVAAAPCLTSMAASGSLTGLRFLAASAPDGVACILIEGGDLQVSGGAVEAAGGPAIDIRGGARPGLDGISLEGGGIVVDQGSSPTITNSSFDGLLGPALIVRGGATPEISANRIAASGPIVFAEGAGGRLAGNRIEDPSGSAIEVTSGAMPEIADNRIVGAAEAGVLVYGAGRPAVAGNEILNSGLSGIVVEEGSAARLSGNRISGSGEHGILVLDGARVIIEGNRVSGSSGRGIAVAPATEVELIDNVLEGNASPQLLDARPGQGRRGGGA
jgi:parallel beta-helix repeat protein